MFAKVYDLLMSDVAYDELLTLIKPYIKPTDLILDAGCGSGYFLKELLLENYYALGVDHDDDMLSIAHQRLTEAHLPVRLYTHDLRKPLAAQVDIVVSFFDVMNYFKGVQKVFENIYQALYNDGKFIFDVYKYEVLDLYDGYVEIENDPISYEWKILRKDEKLIHKVMVEDNEHQVTQYVRKLDTYINLLKALKFKDIKVIDGPDIRKHYIIATK